MSEEKIKLSKLEGLLTLHEVENSLESWRDLCDWIYFNHKYLLKMMKAVRAAEKVVEAATKNTNCVFEQETFLTTHDEMIKHIEDYQKLVREE